MLFNRSAEEVQNLEAKVDGYIFEAFAMCQKIREERGKGYNTKVSVVDYFPHGPQDIIYEVFKKIVRAENALGALKEGKAIDKDRVEDNVLDAMNYLSILYAILKLEEEKETTTLKLPEIGGIKNECMSNHTNTTIKKSSY